jgi:hypothetical protein
MKILSGPFLGNMAFELNDVRLFNLVRRWYDDLVLKLDSVGMYAVFNNAFPDPQSLFHYCKTVIWLFAMLAMEGVKGKGDLRSFLHRKVVIPG